MLSLGLRQKGYQSLELSGSQSRILLETILVIELLKLLIGIVCTLVEFRCFPGCEKRSFLVHKILFQQVASSSLLPGKDVDTPLIILYKLTKSISISQDQGRLSGNQLYCLCHISQFLALFVVFFNFRTLVKIHLKKYIYLLGTISSAYLCLVQKVLPYKGKLSED